jgi:hypothetical protein
MERDALARALDIGGRQEENQEADRLRADMALDVEWRAAARRRVLLAVQLQRANQDWEIHRRRYYRLGTLPTSSVKLLGIGAAADEVDRACAELLKLGIVTAKEIDG